MRFAGDVRAADREYAESLGLGDRIELLGYVSRRRSLELQRDSEALLLLIPDSGGRGKGVLTGKIFEYLAAERPILAVVPPDGAAADLLRETGAGTVVAPDDVGAIRASARRAPPPLEGREPRRNAALAGVARASLTRHARRGARRRATNRRVTAAAIPLSRPRALTLERVTSALFFTTLFVSTFEKVHWNFGGQLGVNDITTILFLLAFLASERRARGEVPANERRRARVLRGFRARLSRRLLGRADAAGPDAVLERDDEVRHPLVVHRRGDRLSRAARREVLLARDRVVHARLRRELHLRDPPARRRRRRGHQPRQPRLEPAHRRREQHQHLREDLRLERLPRQRSHGRSEPPRRDARRAAARADTRLPADGAHAPPQVVACRDARVPASRRDRDALAERLARDSRRRVDPRDPVPPLRAHAAAAVPARSARRRVPRRGRRAQALRRDAARPAVLDGRLVDAVASRDLLVHPPGAARRTRCSASARTTSPSTTNSSRGRRTSAPIPTGSR